MVDFLNGDMQNIVGAFIALALVILVVALRKFIRNLCSRILGKSDRKCRRGAAEGCTQ